MPRAGLDTAAVVRRAAERIDEHGLESLALARVAGDFGVATPSLYKHVGGLDDLVDRVAVLATVELADRLGAAIRGRTGPDGFAALADAYRRFALEHPGTYPLTQRRIESPEWIAAADAAVAALRTVLPPGADDVHRIRVVRAALHGFVDLERRGGFGLPTSVDASFRALVAALAASITA